LIILKAFIIYKDTKNEGAGGTFMIFEQTVQRKDEDKSKEELVGELSRLRDSYSKLKEVVERYQHTGQYANNPTESSPYGLEDHRVIKESFKVGLAESGKGLQVYAKELEVLVAELRLNNDALEKEIHRRELVEKELINARAQAELYLDLIGHDISNIHQIVLGHLELTKEMMETDDNVDMSYKKLIDTSIETLKRSAKLIDNVRTLQKMHQYKLNEEIINLNAMLSDVIGEYDPIVPDKSIKFDCIGSHYVKANPLLHDVFTNLINNSIKHSNRNDVEIMIILVSTRVNDRDYSMVLVEDNGPGISDDLKEKLFNRLQRGQTNIRGSGLGLYIVKTLVESFGGYVKVMDRIPGDHTRGAKFLVYLPTIGNAH
jgi:signal transduction histidine kinase